MTNPLKFTESLYDVYKEALEQKLRLEFKIEAERASGERLEIVLKNNGKEFRIPSLNTNLYIITSPKLFVDMVNDFTEDKLLDFVLIGKHSIKVQLA